MQVHEAVSQMPADSPGRPSLGRALQLIRQVLDESRDALQALRLSRIASLNLEQSLSFVRDVFIPSTGAQFRVFVKGRPAALKPEIQEQIYLIGREALVNSLRHSQATSIEAEVDYSPSRVRVFIRDNGCGIDPRVVRTGKAFHWWGLAGMRDRAESIGAQLRIWSRPGAGTEVEISIPRQIAAEAAA